MKASTVALRDQLAAVLQAQDLPVSTDDVAAQMAPRQVVQACRPGYHLAPRPGRHPSVVSDVCHGDHHQVLVRLWGPDVYPQLRAMEGRGLVARMRLDGDRRVFWVWTGARPDRLVADLEAMWEATA